MSEDGEISTLDAPRRTDPIGLIPLVLTNVRQALVGLIAAYFGIQSADLGFGFTLLAMLAVVALVAGASALSWWRTTYTTGPEDIRVESGIISRQARSVPYERIQDVSKEQPLLARLFGLVQLRFETGAGGKDDLSLAYVSDAEGERLRKLVRDRREVSAAQTAEETDDEPEEQPLFAMTSGRIALFGFFEFSLVVFGVLAAAAQQFDFLLPEGFFDPSYWQQKFGDGYGTLANAGRWTQLFGAVLGVMGLALVGVATGFAKTFAREYGFLLTRSERGFRRRRGLFTRTDVVMPVHRVQAAIVGTGLIRKRWGWHGLKFVSLAQDAGSSNHDVAPFAQMDEIERIADVTALELPTADTPWQRPSPWRWLIGGVLWSAVASYVAAMAYLWGRPTLALSIAAVGIPLIVLRQWLNWQQYRHAIDSRQLYARSGVIKRNVMIAPRQRIQSVEIMRGPLGKLAGYVDLVFGLPGGRLRFIGVPTAAAQSIRDQVVETIAATDYSRSAVGQVS
ncbi:PH domain-containing protein [Altererythrobacter sp. MF3-039]|uniref:PH domain-containing protein n=1 Tax=Altererythrobacter sp. MF3-039 TaxID=3252901 RepID=UPI00390CBB63